MRARLLSPEGAASAITTGSTMLHGPAAPGKPIQNSVPILIKKIAILCHRWMGVAFCLLFLWCFISGIFMMYWDYPAVSAADRLERAPFLDASQVKLSAAEAWAKVDDSDQVPRSVRLAVFESR